MISARIYLSGRTLCLDENDILSLSVSADTGGISPGHAVSVRYALTFAAPGELSVKELTGCRAETFCMGQPLGVWYITAAHLPADSAFIAVTGQDAMGTVLSAAFADSSRAYPRTAGELMRAVIAACPGMRLKDGGFPGADTVIRRMPEWPQGVTLRQTAGYIAFLAGGTARVDFGGDLEVVPMAGAAAQVQGDVSLSGGADFRFNCLNYRFDGDEGYTRFAADGALKDTVSNTIAASGNPLVSRENVRQAAQRLTGFTAEGGSVKLYGIPPALPGNSISCGGHRLYVTRMRFVMNGDGPVTVLSCAVPQGASPVSGGIFNPDGTVCADAIGGFEDRILGASRAYIGALTADEINTTGLSARFAEAVRLKAAEISASETETGSLTAALAEVINISARKLVAGTISADALTAGMAEIMAAKLGSLSADSISTDELAAALAKFSVITAGAAEFDRETVRHLVSELLNVQEAVGGRVFISNLTADYANLLQANVGTLVVGASDGSFYRLDVDSVGNVTAVPTEVTAGERAAGKTGTGKTILETEIAASDLSATNFKAVSALINRLDAARIDVAQLTAQKAYIDHLHTADISDNESIRIAIEAGENTARYMKFDEDGLIQKVPGHVYYTRVDNDGFDVCSELEVDPIATMNAVDGIRIKRVTLGNIICKQTGSGGWVWQEQEE